MGRKGEREKDQGTGFLAPKHPAFYVSYQTHNPGRGTAKQRDGWEELSQLRNDPQLGKMAGVRYERVSQEGRHYENTWNRDKYLGQWAALAQKVTTWHVSEFQ